MTEIKKVHEERLIKDRQSFYFGLVTGVALVSLVGYLLSVFNDNKAPTVNNEAGQAVKSAAVSRVKVNVSNKDHFRGNKNAKITIVVYSDIQCPYCQRFHETMRQVVAAYPNEIKWVAKQFPLTSLHPYAKKAAEATECASDQNKYWELTDKYYENQEQLSDAYITAAAEEVGLDMVKFNTCLSSGKYLSKVETDVLEGKKIGVQGTPGTFINGVSIPGAVAFSEIDQAIKSELAQ